MKKCNIVCHSLFHSTVLQYKQSRIHRYHLCSFTFCWIRNYNSGFGSRQKFGIHADPDPQHWKYFSVIVEIVFILFILASSKLTTL